ncbi:unnamed protein product [Adineta ricciae]|uniref:BTB domain-containing protein n=1 Tax=Adineta ricciae TaxID=249248 RepID=A0A813YVF9_ADIRI|nr:unnamed protein product [Adineta ricciae]CAF1042620.1 unnamed protein product [Adineta ricciae]
MSTWQQHASSNTATSNTSQSTTNHTTTDGLKTSERSNGLGEINHTSVLSGDFGKLYNQSDYSDIELIVEAERFCAHRVILAARSEYFRALLYGGLRESQHDNRTIEIKECKAAAFKLLLQYIYTGRISLIKEKEDVLIDLLGLVHQYVFEELENSLSIYLKSILSLNNVCIIYDTACLYELHALQQHCAQFIDNYATEIIKTSEFLALSADAFASIISRDSFHCPEIEIFYAVKNWHEYHYRDQSENLKPADEIVSKVRLTLMTMSELLKIVRYSNLFNLNHIMDAIDAIHLESNTSPDTNNETRIKNYRGRLRTNENIATKAYLAQVITGEMKHTLLDGDTINYDLDRGYTRHVIDDTHNICVKLDGPSIINHIRLLLWDKDTRAYSYCVEVSVDNINWTRIIDYRLYLCRSWQKLYFPPIVTTYIRVVGTHNTVNKVFHLVSMEVYYMQKSFALIGDIHVPTENVATIEGSAVVSEGVSRIRNALINGDYQSYDWDSGYTCHQIGSGGIIIQLCQPYIISSMRLLLWDCDNRSYSYYIETSYDNATWTKIVDKRTLACRSWQILTFSPRIVGFIRICGTHNTANEVFHCVHFECPCQPDVLKAHMKEGLLTSTSDEKEENSVDYEQFYEQYEKLLDTSTNDSLTDRNTSMQTYTILPFTTKSNSPAVFAIEQ